MAAAEEELNDAEFWLPAEFLDEDCLFSEGESKGGGAAASGRVTVAKTWFDGDWPYGFGSDMGSPVESVTATESSDEEDCVTGLSRQMVQSFLDGEAKDSSFFAGQSPKILAGSPQSTLCAVDNWTCSNGDSPSGPSKVSSPPSTPLEQPKDDALDLLSAAAGEVVRQRLHEQEQEQLKPQGLGLLGPPKQPPSAPISAPHKNPTTCYYALPMPTLQQSKLKQQQLMRQQPSGAWGRQSRAGGSALYGDARSSRPLGLPASAWPPLQQSQDSQPQPQPQPQQQPLQPGSGMRAIFLNGSGNRRESTGTGVFLPRCAGNPPEPRKKSGCSTVLLPAKVVQALNLNLDELSANPRFAGGFVIHHDGTMARGAPLLSQQKRNHHQHPQSAAPAAPAATAHELRLPTEWTY